MRTATRSAVAGLMVLAMLAGCEQSESGSDGQDSSGSTSGSSSGTSTGDTSTGGTSTGGTSTGTPASGESPAPSATGSAPGERSQTAPTTGDANGSTFTLRPKSLAAKDSLGGIAEAVKSFEVNMDRYPTTSEGLEVLISPDRLERDKDKWQGPYVQSMDVLKDTYGNTIEYETTSSGCILRSLGADGQRGGSGSSADVELKF